MDITDGVSELFPESPLGRLKRASEGATASYRDIQQALGKLRPLQDLNHKIGRQMLPIGSAYETLNSLAAAASAASAGLGKLSNLDSNFRRQLLSIGSAYDSLNSSLATMAASVQGLGSLPNIGMTVSPQFTERILGILPKGLERYFEAFAVNSHLHGEWPDRLPMQDYAAALERNASVVQALSDARSQFDMAMRGFNLNALAHADTDELEQAQIDAELISSEAAKEPTAEGFLYKLMLAAQGQEGPVKFFLTYILLQCVWLIIQTLLTTTLENYVAPSLGESSRTTSRHIKEVQKQLGPSARLLTDYRFIAAVEVIVHLNPKIKSPEISRIKFGVVVRVLRQTKDFSLVTWSDENVETEPQGWVLSRYLRKFK